MLRRVLVSLALGWLAVAPSAIAAQAEWQGRYVLVEDRPDGSATRTAVKLVVDGGKLTATYRLVPKNNRFAIENGDVLFDGTIAGNRFKGTIWLRARDPDGEIVKTRSDLSFERQEGNDEIPGDYVFKKLRERTRTWEAGEPVPVRLVPSCRPFAGPIRLGRQGMTLTIALSEAIEPVPEDEDPHPAPGFCHYFARDTASLSLPLEPVPGTQIDSPALTGVTIDFYMREGADPDDPTSFQEVTLSWTDDERGSVVLFRRWRVSFVLYSVGITLQVTQAGDLLLAEGFVDVQLDAANEVRLGGPVYLSGDLFGFIRYQWTANATSWSGGAWSFDGLGAMSIEVRRSGAFPLASLDLEFRDDGSAGGTLQISPEKTFRAAGLEFTLENCSLTADISFADNDVTFRGGEINGKVKIPRVEEPFEFKIRHVAGGENQADRFELVLISPGSFRIFGGTCSGFTTQLTLDIDSMTISEISLRDAGWQHDRFDGAITIRELRWVKGELAEFEGGGRVGFKGAGGEKSLSLDVSRIRYESQPVRLEVSGSVELGFSSTVSGSVDIRKFVIDESGTITEFNVAAALEAGPVKFSGEAEYSGSGMSGSFDGDLGRVIRIAGAFAFGSSNDFNYGYLSLYAEVASGGLPIGQSGLLLIGLGGEVGFNYLPSQSPASGGTARPERGTYYLGGKITIGDVARLAKLEGTIGLTLGTSNAVDISGTLQLTRNTPYFRGELTCGYVFGTERVSGSLTGTVKIPESGAIVDIDRNTLDYRLENGRWQIDGRNLGGDLFGVLELRDGRVNMRGNLDSPISSLRGSLGGRLSASVHKAFSKPGSSVSASGSVRLTVSGQPDVSLDQNGVRGSFQLTAYMSGQLHVTVDTFLGSATFSPQLSARAQVTATMNRTRLNIDGTFSVCVSVGFDWCFDYEVDYDL